MNDNWSTKYHYFVWAPLAWKTALHRVGKLRMSEFKLTCGFLWIQSDFSNRATSRSLELDEAGSSCWICLCWTSQTCLLGLKSGDFEDRSIFSIVLALLYWLPKLALCILALSREMVNTIGWRISSKYLIHVTSVNPFWWRKAPFTLEWNASQHNYCIVYNSRVQFRRKITIFNT